MTTDEEKISSIYQQGKEQSPPAHLDSSILRAAHEAVEQEMPADRPTAKKSSMIKSPFSGGWPVAASIAAVLVITVILIPLVEQEEPAPVVFDTSVGEPERLQGLSREREQASEHDRQQDSTERYNSLHQKEKAKKRMMGNAPEIQLEKRIELNKYRLLPEKDSARKQAPVEKSMVPMRSATPAPASMAIGATDLQSQELKSEAVIQQKRSLMMDANFVEGVASVDNLTPQQWLDKIRQLIEKGEIEAAQKELDKFKLRYPREKIDPSILEQIKNRP